MKTIKTVEDLKNTKIYIPNKEDRERFQKYVLSLGVKWYGGESVVKNTKYQLFYIREYNGEILMTAGECGTEFNKDKGTQLFIDYTIQLKSNYEFKAKDWVLVKHSAGGVWWLTRFSHYDKDSTYPYACINGNGYKSCIPYEGNEHLVGTTKNK